MEERLDSDFAARFCKPREKPVDKRKASEKDDSLDTSETRSFTSRPGPTKKLKLGTTGTSFGEEEEDLLKDDNSKTLDSLSESAEAGLLRTTTEAEGFQSKGKDEGNESGDSNNSDKFYSQIKEMEEKDKLSQVPQPVGNFPNVSSAIPAQIALEHKNAAVANWAENNNKYAPPILNESSSLEEVCGIIISLYLTNLLAERLQININYKNWCFISPKSVPFSVPIEQTKLLTVLILCIFLFPFIN
jgi:hypothetical protein